MQCQQKFWKDYQIDQTSFRELFLVDTGIRLLLSCVLDSRLEIGSEIFVSDGISWCLTGLLPRKAS
jgi:hypothetical protein